MPLTLFWFLVFVVLSSIYFFLPVSVSLIVSFVIIFLVSLSLVGFYVVKQRVDRDISALIWALRNTPKKEQK